MTRTAPSRSPKWLARAAAGAYLRRMKKLGKLGVIALVLPLFAILATAAWLAIDAVSLPGQIDRVDLAGGTLSGWSALLTMIAAPRLSAGGEVTVLDLPIEIPRFNIAQYWHDRFHADPGNRWLRGVCAELFQQREVRGAITH